MSNYTITKAARADLRATAAYIAKDNETASTRWRQRIFTAFELIGDQPGLGHSRQAAGLPLLFWNVGVYVIVYRVNKHGVTFLAVLHGARDLPAILSTRI